MNRRWLWVFAAAVLVIAAALGFGRLDQVLQAAAAPFQPAQLNQATSPGQAAPEVFYSGLHGGCYIAAPNQCKIHVDPFVVKVSAGKTLVYFQVLANRAIIYDFRTDTGSPPTGDYTPTLVMQDFGAQCGKSYTLNLFGQDSGDSTTYTLGQSGTFSCPSSIP